MKTQRSLVVCLLLASASVVSAQVLPPGPTDLDHFNCYIPLPPPPQQPVTVLLQDEFDQQTSPLAAVLVPNFELVTDISPFRLCNPVTKLHNDVTTGQLHPDAHLLMYRINNQPSMLRSVTIRNQFTTTNSSGTATLTTGAAVILAVPSGKALIPATSGVFFQIPQIPPAAELDHFKCYIAAGDPLAVVNPNTGVVTSPVNVLLSDEFRTDTLTTVLAPRYFCNPVEKIRVNVSSGDNANGDQNGNGPAVSTTTTPINHPRSHLTCYETLSTASFPTRPIAYNNQFVPPDIVGTLQVTFPDLLCVPSFKLAFPIITPPTSGPTPPTRLGKTAR